MPILRTMQQQQPQLVVFLGDNIYADTSDLDLMRAKYGHLAANEDFCRLRAACPSVATWDDHDYGQNDGGADFAARDGAQQAFVDFWQDPPESPRRHRPGVYDAHLYGPPDKRLQVILLDTRYFRSPLKQGPRRVGGPYVPDDDVSKTMLGDAQWAWLQQQLRIPARLRVIATSIQCVAEAAGQETWSNLPKERQRLFQLIARSGAKGVVLISGDRHWAELSVARDGAAYPLYDLTSSSFNQKHPRGTPTENAYRAIDKTYHQENFGQIVVDWTESDPAIRLQIRDLQGRLQIDHPLRLSDLAAPQ